MKKPRQGKGSAESAETFESELARLEAIVEELQDEEVELDVALQLFEEGVRRLRGVTGRLSTAEAKVKLLLEDEDGFGLADFDG